MQQRLLFLSLFISIMILAQSVPGANPVWAEPWEFSSKGSALKIPRISSFPKAVYMLSTTGGPDPRSDSNEFFIERVKSIGGPKIKIIVGTTGELYDRVADNSNSIHLGSGFASQVRPGGVDTKAHRLFVSPVHFGLTAQEHLGYLYEGGGLITLQRVLDRIAETQGYSLDPIGFGPTNARGPVIMVPLHLAPAEATGWFPEAVPEDPNEFNNKGWRLRFNPYEAEVMKQAFPGLLAGGGSPGVSPINGLCLTGEFDGIEFADPNEDVAELFVSDTINPVACGAPHFYLGTWHNQTNLVVLLMNKKWFQRLPKKRQERTLSASQESTLRALARGFAQASAAFQLFVEKGAIIHKTLPPKILDALRAAEEVVHADFAAADPNFAELLNDIRGYATSISPYLTNHAVQPDERFNTFKGWESEIPIEAE